MLSVITDAPSVESVTGFKQAEARRALLAALQALGLSTFADLTPTHGDPSIATKPRLDTWRTDRELVFALLDQYRWITTFARHNHRVDRMDLRHRDTGARLHLIVQLPQGAPDHWEAA